MQELEDALREEPLDHHAPVQELHIIEVVPQTVGPLLRPEAPTYWGVEEAMAVPSGHYIFTGNYHGKLPGIMMV